MVVNCVKDVKGKDNGGNVHQIYSTAVFDQRTPLTPRRKRLCLPLSLTLIDVNPTAITATPVPAAIPYHASSITIPAHVTAGTNTGYDRTISDNILDIIEMGSTSAATGALSSLCYTIINSLHRAQ